MSIASRLIARLAKLPPAHTYDVGVERDLRATMPDGVVLLADRYFPRHAPSAPIVLMRSPYGRRFPWGEFGRVFAERGYQAVVQSCRGTFGSGGEFDAMRNEQRDGRATLGWLAGQSWFSGSVGMTGASYLGFVQWAVAADAPPFVKALAPQITASQFRSLTYPGESFNFKTGLTWIHLLHYQELPMWQAFLATRREQSDLAPAYMRLPLAKADEAAVGERVSFYQDWLAHNEPGDPFWQEIDYSRGLDRVSAPVNLVAAWYDIFLPDQLADYAALKRAGKTPYLTIGPWIHSAADPQFAGLRESLAWFDAHLRGDASRLRSSPVRIFVMGTRQWVDLPDWPPPARSTRWHLHAHGVLGAELPADSPPDTYRYDPADPTPSVGGTELSREAGPRDNRAVEARPDVLTYTSAPLQADLEVIGPVSVTLYARSSLEHTDFFARLCDVQPNGRSINVCDGLLRLWPGRLQHEPDGVICLPLELWPTAYRFARGHRLRLQVSSGSHPRFARNPGNSEPLGTATTLVAADQAVFHDPAHPSALVLPVYTPAGG